MKTRSAILAVVLAAAAVSALFVAYTLLNMKSRVMVTGLSSFSDSPGSEAGYWVTESGMAIIRGFETSGMVTINIPEMAPMVFTSSSCFFGHVNLHTGNGTLYHEYVLTYPTEGQVVGTFKGMLMEKTTGGYPANHITMNCELKGTGVFKGYTMFLSSDGPNNGSGILGGYILSD